MNETIVVVDDDDTDVLGFFKWPRPGSSYGSLYSIGIERVYFELGRPLGIPMCDTHLEVVEGHHGLVSVRAPNAKSWFVLNDDIVESRATFVDRDTWPVAIGLDILLGNIDRHAENIFVQWDPPQSRPRRGEECGTWFIDFGHCGLFPPAKFDPSFKVGDILKVAETADLLPAATHGYFVKLPQKLRVGFPGKGTEERARLVETIRSITDDQVEHAVANVPAPYFSADEAELTARWIKARLPRVDTLLDDVIP